MWRVWRKESESEAKGSMQTGTGSKERRRGTCSYSHGVSVVVDRMRKERGFYQAQSMAMPRSRKMEYSSHENGKLLGVTLICSFSALPLRGS